MSEITTGFEDNGTKKLLMAVVGSGLCGTIIGATISAGAVYKAIGAYAAISAAIGPGGATVVTGAALLGVAIIGAAATVVAATVVAVESGKPFTTSGSYLIGAAATIMAISTQLPEQHKVQPVVLESGVLDCTNMTGNAIRYSNCTPS